MIQGYAAYAPNMFDEDYFERGLETGKSCYQNYRWIPELTIPMAMAMVDYMRIEPHHKILDYGCCKGYLVKALRLLRRNAWGIDISPYAIANVDPGVKKFCRLMEKPPLCSMLQVGIDLCISKDVFEHVPEKELRGFLEVIPAKKMFAVIPLGEGGEYRAPVNNLDVTHCTCESEGWWAATFREAGWVLERFTFRVEGIKDSYAEAFPDAHGFFTLKKERGSCNR